MTRDKRLGGLIEAFVNKVSHPRGRVLTLMARASVTVPQVILLNFALTVPDSTPSGLAAKMRMSRPSVSQMVDRLVRLKLVERVEHPTDRRRKTVSVTARGKSLLARLSAVRSAEFRAGAAELSASTKAQLIDALAAALRELEMPVAPRTRGGSRTR
jgi:DNA-binding MarR family transcriptional regulator